MRVVATAGHVDHGKSSLVLALTGTDPDRFPEEKARGLTIDLGFAFTTLPSGREVGFVDVPGHVRFIKNMLAGVGAVDVVLLVVAANEGWMPQSEEHLQILELLGVHQGVVALTKVDTVDADVRELARLELDERLAKSTLAGAPVVECDSMSGRGVADLRTALDAALAAAADPADLDRPRLWIDRVFAARGAGTVVTGTLTGGSLAVDDEVEVGAPGRRARVRGIETAHRRVQEVRPGARVALNLAGVDHHEVARGDAVVAPGQWRSPEVLDVAIRLLSGSSLRRRARVQCHVGSGEREGRLRLLDSGGRFARLRVVGAPVPLAPGDRIVLRDPGRRCTIGAAEVLDVAPTGNATNAATRLELELGPRLLAASPWLLVAELGPLTGAGARDAGALAAELVDQGDAFLVGDWLVAADEVRRTRKVAVEAVTSHHQTHPLEPGLELPALARAVSLDADRVSAALAGLDGLVVEHGIVRAAAHRSRTVDAPEAQRVISALMATPFAPPDPESIGADRGLVRNLVREGALVDLDGVVLAAPALADARARVQTALRERGSLTVADVRDLLGSTRKFVVPILNRLDAEGVTRRRGDDRIPGPATLRADS
jgi:selenocysteine-specific elongation factor